MKPKQGDVYVNVPNSRVDGSRKVFCPLCYYDLEDIPMVFDPTSQCWKCNRCKYVMEHHLDPVGDPKIAAGNDVALSKPFMRTVSFHISPPKPSKDAVYMTPKQAWESD